MNNQALAIAQSGNALYSNISVGDLVVATINKGSQFVTCRVFAVDNASISFLWNGIVFSVETELAAQSTLLVKKFNRAELIAEIKALALGKVA